MARTSCTIKIILKAILQPYLTLLNLAEAYGCIGIRATKPEELDDKIIEMINTDRPVIFDCMVDKEENCFPMIPSGKAHNQMLLGEKDQKET